MTRQLCSIDGCGKYRVGWGWCANHWRRWKRYGDPLGGGPPRQKPISDSCSIAGCGKKPEARGWCHAHYKIWRKYGDPLAVPSRETKNGEPLRFCREVALKYSGDECVVWPFARDPRGYGYVRADGENKIVSRYICEQAHGPAPTDVHEAAHSCGNGDGGCVTPKHIRWATPAENSADRIIHGTSGKGEKNARAKRTEDEIREIRRLHRQGLKNKDICSMFGMGSATISRIVHHQSWRHIQ